MEHIDIAANALEYAIKNGAEEASIKLSTGNGFSVVFQNQAIDFDIYRKSHRQRKHQ